VFFITEAQQVDGYDFAFGVPYFDYPVFEPDRPRPFHLPGPGTGPQEFDLKLVVAEFPPA
jgi:hypothetical protein